MTTGRPNLITSVSATMAGMGLNDIAQLLAFIVAIASGLLAIRHYWVSTRLDQLRIQKLLEGNCESEAETDY